MANTNQIDGAELVARSLRQLGVTTIFGLTGYPVTSILERAIDLGITFIGFRNEQAASYAATAYGYLTGKPACCIVVGGPGVVHAMAGVRTSVADRLGCCCADEASRSSTAVATASRSCCSPAPASLT